MNEADRCDRISLMHRGRVLAVGAPKELANERGKESLEDAFISYLEEAGEVDEKPEKKAQPAEPAIRRRNGPQACRVPRVEAL